MFERNIFDEYKLYSEERFMLGDYEGFTAGNKHYFLVCIDEIDDEIAEMISMGEHLQKNGDHEVATFVPTSTNSLTSFVAGQNCLLFQFPQYYSRSKAKKSTGYELARLHKRGKFYQNKKQGSGTWPEFWAKRLSQLDYLYGDVSKKKQKSSFDQAFMISYPYYLGRTENAIQYIVDTDLDLGRLIQNETKVICHYKFTPKTWLTVDDRTLATVKNPLGFMYDHPSRDLAEWIRATYHGDYNLKGVTRFLNDYEKVENISIPTWRYIYGRLLFPIEYFQVIENFYRSMNEEEEDHYIEKLYELFSNEKESEIFLRRFQSEVVPNDLKRFVQEVDWLRLSSDRKFM